ncbi:hypothetical protein Gogos_018287 [Gossypium gossypioides]|uniref:Uncharacterized protein n=1 Tax=Gossypium gossypioides TaxID=34282 RepID=A0A7J9BDM6_GOSGO|nr:hypothetical protein [Gossypium gossypioides]
MQRSTIIGWVMELSLEMRMGLCWGWWRLQ